MLRQDDIEQQLELLKAHRSTLAHLLRQQALVGAAYASPGVLMGIYEARDSIRRIKQILRNWGVVVEDHPDDGAPGDTDVEMGAPAGVPTPTISDWQQALSAQRQSGNKHEVISTLRTFISDFCEPLDFVVIPESYYNYHNQFVACRVKAPTLHLSLPSEFPLILMLTENTSSELIEQLPNIPKMMGISADFGIVLTPDAHRRIQQLVNEMIRPALKTDLIVLGKGFLDDIANSVNPKTILLREIIREVDLTRVSPFMAGGAVLNENMFFGREGELRNIAENIKKTSIAITCGRRMGKTTLLRRLHHVVLPARKQRSFFLDCQIVHDYHELLAELAAASEHPQIPFDPSQPNSFAQVADVLSDERSESPIFLMDEIDSLLEYDSRHEQRLFKQMRALSLAGHAHFIMTGERMVQAQLRDADMPLFNFFGLKVRLSFLDLASVNKLIIEPLSDMQIELRDPLPMMQTIFDATSGHPYLVQRLCHELILTISRQGVRVIGPEHIEIALNNNNYQEDYFDTIWGQAPQLARVITMLVGSQGTTLKDIRQRLEQYGLTPSLSDISTALSILDLYSVLEHRKGRYYFLATGFPAMRLRAYGDDLETNIELFCEEYKWEQRASPTPAR